MIFLLPDSAPCNVAPIMRSRSSWTKLAPLWLCAFVFLMCEAKAAKADWTGERRWVGPDWYAAPLQDWSVTPQGLAATPRTRDRRFVHCITRELADPAKGFKIETTVELAHISTAEPERPAAGMALGNRGNVAHFLHSVVYPKQFVPAGLTAGGDLVLGETVQKAGIAAGTPVRLSLDAHAENGQLAVTLRASKESGEEIAKLQKTMDADAFRGAFGVFAAGERKGPPNRPDLPVYATFRDFAASGPAFAARDEFKFGPVLWSQYSLANQIVRIQAQFPPLEPGDAQKARLELQTAAGDWKEAASAPIEPASSTALFELRDWQNDNPTPYRIVYNWQGESFSWEGTIRPEPASTKPWRLGLFSCDDGYLFPQADLMREVARRDPAMLFFAGDQFYEWFGGFGVVRDPAELARLDYLRKWYLFGWAYRDILKDRPSIIIPDDHDVFQGNVWGQGGRAIPLDQKVGKGAPFPLGGYIMEPDWLNLVQRSQTGHLPAPYNPAPVERGISVYYTGFPFGGVSFAVLEDRKFKIGPSSEEARQGDTTLLGDRQIEFLEAWAQDWSGDARIKCILSQTIFAQPVTHVNDDLKAEGSGTDNNGWPVEGRALAVATIRKAAAFSLHGDQHLGLQLHHGIEEWEDAGIALMGPATTAGYPRAWMPDRPPEPGGSAQGEYLGRYLDKFRNKMTVLAVANPTAPSTWPEREQDPIGRAMGKASGYAMIDFDPVLRTMTTHVYPLPYPIDESRLDGEEYEGWPLTFPASANDGRKPIGTLPVQTFPESNPVVGLYEKASGSLVYARRIEGSTFAPPVFAPGKYEVRWGRDRPDKTMGTFSYSASGE